MCTRCGANRCVVDICVLCVCDCFLIIAHTKAAYSYSYLYTDIPCTNTQYIYCDLVKVCVCVCGPTIPYESKPRAAPPKTRAICLCEYGSIFYYYGFMVQRFGVPPIRRTWDLLVFLWRDKRNKKPASPMD